MDLNAIVLEAFTNVASSIPWWLWCIVAGLMVIRFQFGNTRHLVNIFKARKALTALRKIESPAQQFSFLRKVDPFIFEEMILTSLADTGAKIKRNHRYTGDGGIDGRATIKGTKYLIQAKRYKGHISAQHVKEFADICRRQRKKGLFIHTGKTGKQAWNNASGDQVTVISGAKMLGLMNAKAGAV